MKLGFTADLHIKLNQKNVPATWLKNRYYKLFRQLADYNDKIDLWVVGGDIFDKIPTVEELEIFFDFVSYFTKDTIIYSGNHEALKKNTTFLSNLKNTVSKLNASVKIIDDYYSVNGIDFIPYNKLKEWANDPDNTFVSLSNRILCTHVRGEIPPHVKAEVPLELFDRWKVVLAGDLHSYDNCQRNILYPGSPITTSFHRSNVDTGFIIIDTDTLDYQWIKLDLPQLIRKTIKAGEPTPPGEIDYIVYEVEGDLAELELLDDHELIDKKIVKREIDTSLILDPELSLEEEVTEYLRYILQLSDQTIEEVLMELHNYSDKIK